MNFNSLQYLFFCTLFRIHGANQPVRSSCKDTGKNEIDHSYRNELSATDCVNDPESAFFFFVTNTTLS